MAPGIGWAPPMVSPQREAGPSSGSGRPVGTVFVAVAAPTAVSCSRLDASGDRPQIQQATVEGALRMLAEVGAAALVQRACQRKCQHGNNGDRPRVQVTRTRNGEGLAIGL